MTSGSCPFSRNSTGLACVAVGPAGGVSKLPRAQATWTVSYARARARTKVSLDGDQA